MHLRIPVTVKIGTWSYQPVNGFDNLTIFDNDDTNAAYTAAGIVGRFEIYGGEVLHGVREDNYCIK